METSLLTLISQSRAADKQILQKKLISTFGRAKERFLSSFRRFESRLRQKRVSGSFAQMISDSVNLPPVVRPLMLMAIETHQHNLMLCQMSLIKEAHQGSGIIDIQTQIYTNNNTTVLRRYLFPGKLSILGLFLNQRIQEDLSS